MKKASLVIIGGGASGMMAAISAARNGRSVILCERLPQIGKKLLASGNGRCNLLNDDLTEEHYNEPAHEIVKKVFSRFGKKEILAFFKDLGLVTVSDNGRIFPITNQASSVLKVLEIELKKLRVPIELSFEVKHVSASNSGFVITSKDGRRLESERIIIAAGGKSYPALGSNGSGYELARSFGHSIVEPVPSAVPVVVKDSLCHFLQGQKISVIAKAIIDGNDVSKSSGELLFTKYGLSGTAIMDISEEISIAVNRKNDKDVFVSIDMAPFLDEASLVTELGRRLEKGITREDLPAGILPNKFSVALKEILEKSDPKTIALTIKDKRFKVIGTRGWNEAEFTAGGVDLNEVRADTLGSKLREGLYFCGEMLDVDGRRGGYNLAWAWASGFIAGQLK